MAKSIRERINALEKMRTSTMIDVNKIVGLGSFKPLTAKQKAKAVKLLNEVYEYNSTIDFLSRKL